MAGLKITARVLWGATNGLQTMNETRPQVSAVIPSWNRKVELMRCINSLLSQRNVALEIIVVDDRSTDGSVEMVRKSFPDVVVICGDHSVGPAYRRNQGILASRGDYVLQLDSDTEFNDPEAIAHMADKLSSAPDVGSVGGEIAAHVGDFNHVHALVFDRMDRPQRISGGCDADFDCDYLATLCCMMRRNDLLVWGGYDPYGEYGGEDADLGFRIKNAGFRNVASYKCAALHHASPSGRHEDASYRFCLAWWRFVIKHRGVAVFLMRFGWYVMRLCLLMPLTFNGRGHRRNQIAVLSMAVKAAAANLRQVIAISRMSNSNYLGFKEMGQFEGCKTKIVNM